MKLAVIGIDPALNNMGFAHAVIDTDTNEIDVRKLVLAETKSHDKKTSKVVRKNSDDLSRARVLYNALQEETKGNTFAFAEVPVGSQSARAMASYGICIGVLASCGIPLIQLTPTEVKMASVGIKTASKQEMIDWAMSRYPKANWLMRRLHGELVPMNDNEHLADAVAAIHAGLESEQFLAASVFFQTITSSQHVAD
jgi:Holliday junction resolvasome RuvABC endonuclease subunit